MHGSKPVSISNSYFFPDHFLCSFDGYEACGGNIRSRSDCVAEVYMREASCYSDHVFVVFIVVRDCYSSIPVVKGILPNGVIQAPPI